MPDKTDRYPDYALIFKDHDNYYAWRNVQPATGDVTFTVTERELVKRYIDRLEKAVTTLSLKGHVWPWETIDREVD